MRLFTTSSTLFLIANLLAAGCGDDSSSVTCGPGTHQDGTVCIPDGTDGDAPTVASIEPSSGLVGGGEPFTITGSGFESIGDISVTFGDSVAAFEVVSDSEISGTTPRASAAAVTVTVTNTFGSGTADFQYRGLYGADGKGAVAGNLWLVDPRDGTSVVIGPIESDVGPHAVTGLAFDADGTLWATDATSGLDTGPAPAPQLMTIDPATGHATLVGPLVAGDVSHRSIAAITFAGSTLLGWTRTGNAPVSIDTGSGEVTVLGEGLGEASFGNALVATGDGSAVVFPAGASDGAGIRGQFFSVDASDGALAQIGTLGGTGSASVCGATLYQGTLIALLCPHLAELSGSVLASVDPSDGTITNIAAGPLGLDAIASDEPAVPASGRFVPPSEAPSALLPDAECSSSVRISLGTSTRTISGADLGALAGSTPVRTRRAGARGLPLSVVAGSREVAVVSCGGSSLRLSAADLAHHALVENSRGLIKLVDTASGRTVVRGVIELRAP